MAGAYYCRKGAGLGGCGGISTIADPVEDEVRKYVIGKLCDPKYRKQLVRLSETAADESESLADQLADAEAQRDMLLDLYLEKKVNKATYERRYAALTDTIEVLGRTAFSAPQHSVLRDLPPTVEQLDELWDDKGIGFQRQLIDLVIQRVEVLPGQQGRKAFDPNRLVWHPGNDPDDPHEPRQGLRIQVAAAGRCIDRPSLRHPGVDCLVQLERELIFSRAGTGAAGHSPRPICSMAVCLAALRSRARRRSATGSSGSWEATT